jgi:Neuraminidase (sialidase)
MAVARSGDGGKTWKATYFNQQTGVAQFDDKPFITVDTNRKSKFFGRIYVAWDHATGSSSSSKNGNNVIVSHSDDGGVTFSEPSSVSGDFTGRTGGIAADPYVTRDGTLHVAWQDYAHMTIAEASSTDGGESFSSPHVIALVGGFDFSIPAEAVRGALVYPSCDSSGSALFCSFMNGTDLAAQVYVSKSTNGGLTWSKPKAMPAGGDQFNQWLAVDDSNGSVNVTYYDTAGDPTKVSTLYTLARSTDGGSTYTASPVANARTDESCCAPSVNLGNQYGDYEQVAAAGGIVRPVWTDRRQAVIDLGLREEVFTATLTP